MKMNDMVIISVDDHVCEPPDMFKNQLSGKDLEGAPVVKTSDTGADYWEYQGMRIPNPGLNSVVGRVPEEFGVEPTAFSQLRKGCYDAKARIDDMNVNGIAGSLNFGSWPGIEGGVFHRAQDKAKALVHLRAYNDWHVDEWCGSAPGRFIPCALLPTWDMNATVAEVARLAKKGCKAVSLNDNPTKQNLPSIHNPYWEPLWKAVAEHDVTICLHIGAGNASPHASMESPIESHYIIMPISIAIGAADWLYLDALERYPNMKIALSEGGIGWVPYFLERADFTHKRHNRWTHSRFKNNAKPSDVFRKHFINCFIDDSFGLQTVDFIGEDTITYECDYPHSDSLWPNAPETLYESIKHLSDVQIDKITHGNAIRFFNFDMFKHHKREELTVGALRAKAAAAKVDVTPKSFGGAMPLEAGEKARVVTSGDIQKQFASLFKVA